MSNSLEKLQDLKNAFVGHCRELKCEENYIKVCENKFSKIEEELKRLEIIKKSIYDISVNYWEDVDKYTIMLNNCSRVITKEEYELMKEVLDL